MKKILLLAAALLVILLAGAVIFVVTFDADRFRPRVQKEIENVLGQPVEIEKISLGWRSGPSLEVKGLNIPALNSTKALLSVESFGAQMDFAPLLQGRVEISSVFADKLKARVVKKADGTIRFFENAGSSNSSGGPASALTLLVEAVHIRDAEIAYHDEAAPMAEDIVIRDLDIRLKDVSLAQAFPFEAAASLLSPGQNLKLSGNIRYLSREQAVSLEDVRFETNLADIDFREVSRVMPSAAESFDGLILEGEVTAILDPLTLSQDKQAEPLIRLSLEKGRYRAKDTPAIENIEAGISLTSREAVLKGFSGDFAGSKIGVSGRMKLTRPEPESSFQATITGLDLSELMPPAGSRDPKPEGRVTVTLNGGFFGADAERVQQTLSGNGLIISKDAVIRDLNVIRELMKKLSIIPGLVQRLQERLPPSYQEKLDRRDTFFAPVEIPFTLASGRANFPQILIASESFAISGSAQADLIRQSISAPMSLVIDPELSQAFIRSVQELQYLADREGRLTIPFQMQGVVPDIRVQPDISFITSRLAVAKAQEVLSGLFEKKKAPQPDGSQTQGEPQASQDNTAAAPSAETPGQVLFGQLLQNVLGGGQSAGGASQDN